MSLQVDQAFQATSGAVMVTLRPQLAREINSNAEEEILGVHLLIWMLCYSILIILFWYKFLK